MLGIDIARNFEVDNFLISLIKTVNENPRSLLAAARNADQATIDLGLPEADPAEPGMACQVA